MNALPIKRFLAVLALLATSFVNAEYYPTPEYRIFGQAPSKADENAIDELMASFRDAWGSQDATGVAALHVADVEWVNAFGRTFRGADELQEFLSSVLFPGFEPEVWQQAMASYKAISRRYIASDVAVINAQIHSSPGSAAGRGSRRVSLNFVLAKSGGQWRIAHPVIADVREKRSSRD